MYSSSINNLEPFKSHTCIELFDFKLHFALLVLLLYTIQLINSSYTFTTCIVELGIDTQTQMLYLLHCLLIYQVHVRKPNTNVFILLYVL